MSAPLGDDVLGDDPTVKKLEERFAALMGKAAAVFMPSGTQGNQASIRALTEPGDEIIAHEESHVALYEGGAPAALSGCMIRFLRGSRGQFTAEDVLGAVRARNDHFPITKLVVIENTQNRGGGSIWPIDRIAKIEEAARSRGVKMHLDGARLWNAHVTTGVPMARYAGHFDTVTCCFSKGLGAPVGSAVASDGATIARVRRFRKQFGGGMRQSGLLAAAALYAMDHHVVRLADDHANAKRLAEALAAIPGVSLEPDQKAHGVESNLVFFDLGAALPFDGAGFCERMAARGVLMLPTAPRRVRAVTHLDVSRDGTDRAIEAARAVCGI